MSDALNDPRIYIEDRAIGNKIATVLVCRQAGKKERIFSLVELYHDGTTKPLPSIAEAREAFDV